jgi:peptidoglycan/xylan/chitin deacetylase (PgdA/CDA1 family)
MQVELLFRKMLFAFCALAMLAAPAVSHDLPQDTSAQRTVAITFDDIPIVTSLEGKDSEALAIRTNRKILKALKRRRAPATGFVNESKFDPQAPATASILESWNSGDFELANHGFSHADSNELDLAEIERELLEGEKIMSPLAEAAGRSIRFFRFPYNHIGDTEAKQAGAYALLAAHDYTLAASTIDTSDYLFNDAYVRALSERDRKMQTAIRRAYLDHTKEQIEYYAGLNRHVLGYEPPAIMLLHVNPLNADTMSAQLSLFRKAGYRFISLAQAQADPAYARPLKKATRFGPMWGYRWARDRGIAVDGALEEEPAAWISEYAAGK